MKFGKLDTDTAALDFSALALPLDDVEATRRVVSRHHHPAAETPVLYIGATGWGMREWVGGIYPNGTKPRDYLMHYARAFNTIELNATHYRTPDPTTVETWRRAVTESGNSGFKFSPKIPQSVSHSRDMGATSDAMPRFVDNILGLGDMLGCGFVQLPPHFAFSSGSAQNLDTLERFLATYAPQLAFGVELRHESWFGETVAFEVLANLCEQYSTPLVITDTLGRRDVLHSRLTTPTAMVRFVTTADTATTDIRIEAWLDRLDDWFAAGVKAVYFFAHTPDNIAAPALIAEITRRAALRWATKKRVRVYEPPSDAPNEPLSLF